MSFVNNDWFWQVAIITLAIWIVFIWKEFQKSRKRKAYINCIVAFVALTSLALMILKPITTESSITSLKTAILTKGFDNLQLDSLKKVYKKLDVRSYEPNQITISKDENLETVFVLGNGLQQYDLWQLDDVNTIYIGGKPSKGVNQFVYNMHNTVGNDAIFNGQYVQPNIGHKLFLENPAGQALDSVVLTNDKVQEFQLSISLKVKGEFVYQLVEKDDIGNNISKDPLPIIVKPQEQLKVLIVNASPLFETKYLKNYLAEVGHQVSIRSRLTKGRYKYEYFNVDTKPKIGFTKDQLKVFDVVITDALTINSLSTNAKKALEASISEDGLGLFIQPDINLYNSHKRWYAFNFMSNRKSNASLDIDLKNTVTKYPFAFRNDALVEPIFNADSHIMSAYKRLGIGRIGTSVLKNTYELQLKGTTEVYRQLWAKTIEDISKKSISNIEWNQYSQIAFVNEPFEFQIRTTEENPLVVSDEAYQIPLKRDISIKSLWSGVTYPKETGWKAIKTEQDSTKVFKYFVTDNAHWQSLKTTNTINANKKYFDTKNQKSYTFKGINTPINLMLFYVIFILGIGYLWLEPKL